MGYINHEALNEYTDDNAELKIELLNTIVEDAPPSIKTLHEAIDSGDSKNIEFYAHKLVNLARYVGVQSLEMELREIQSKAEVSNFNFKEAMVKVDYLFKKLLVEISEYIKENN